jgi:hypothetical protein
VLLLDSVKAEPSSNHTTFVISAVDTEGVRNNISIDLNQGIGELRIKNQSGLVWNKRVLTENPRRQPVQADDVQPVYLIDCVRPGCRL